MLQRDIAQLEPPSKRVLAAMRHWLHGSSGVPNTYSKLEGKDAMMFSNELDLIALRPPTDNDLLTRLFRNHWPFPSEVCCSHAANVRQ
jgi:hypothetical protein